MAQLGAAMRKTFLASVSAVALSCTGAMPAHAAPPTPMTWTGFYVGGNAGYAWSNTDVSLTGPLFDPLPGGIVGTVPSLDPHGFIGGIQTGYNWQTGQWVFGGELAFSGMDAKADATVSPFFTGKGANTVDFSSRYDWLFTARARGGFLVAPNWLLYVTGGLAVTHVRDSVTCSSSGSGCLDSTTPQLVTWSDSKTLAGGTIGGGVETMFAPNWTARVEYLYAKFQDTTPSPSTANGVLSPIPSLFSFHHDLNAVTFAINYKFNP